ncbi:hypothetical protein EVAR_15098_1 [Eumeta japonica]|uniref:Uncharacterized protein n=1 Tax=Eumeta variegata TaxID=151549 RepID=A0A4C1UJF3_EUMVA|nr:hypothetical protein EVAR_15098_1 [Eumeta japonica]
MRVPVTHSLSNTSLNPSSPISPTSTCPIPIQGTGYGLATPQELRVLRDGDDHVFSASSHAELLRSGGGIVTNLLYQPFRNPIGEESEVKERYTAQEDVVTRVEKCLFRWFGYQQRMKENKLTKQIYRTIRVMKRSGRVALKKSMLMKLGAYQIRVKF